MLLQGSLSKVVSDEQDRNFSECFCRKISEGIRVIKILKQLTIKKNKIFTANVSLGSNPNGLLQMSLKCGGGKAVD